MSFTLHGIPVSQGIAIGKAYLMGAASIDVDHYLVDAADIPAEVARFVAAQDAVHAELNALRTELPPDAPGEMDAFLNVHSLILRDAMLSEATAELIRTRHYNAEWALTEQLAMLVSHFDEIDDPYLRERRADVEQVAERVLKVLAGQPSASALLASRTRDDSGMDMIVVAHDIAPADMLQFKTQSFGGFVTDLGGRTSHTAIVARSFGIPAAVGVYQASTLIRQDDVIIVDGERGVVVVDPSSAVLDEYRYRQSERALAIRKLELLRSATTQTMDGTPIALMANIELPGDGTAAKKAGAAGVGLFRTEFLFMNRKGDLPDEDEQIEQYCGAIEAMEGLPVTIRTIDVGADKPLDPRSHDSFEAEMNPALGLRAIRWCLSEPQMFLTQLRAILRASGKHTKRDAAGEGAVRILIPMLAHASEIDQTLDLIDEAKRQCDAAGLAYDPNIKVGAMIEVPAAALSLPLFLKRFDFLSIGTNDLIQYTLAIDRTDNAVAHLFDPLHPAVLSLISSTIRESKRARVPVAVCGEMAGDPTMTRLLLGMGLREFSMHPSQLLVVKREVLRADLAAIERAVADLLAMYEPLEIKAAFDRLALL